MMERQNERKLLSVEKFQKRLETISEYNGQAFGRAYRLFEAEDEHTKKCIQYKGYLSLSDAFKCFFLESIELINTECFPKWHSSLPESYILFSSHLVHSFKSLFGAERLALKGYPFQACALLRNTFDGLVLVSACLQKITDFSKIEGIQLGEPLDQKVSKKIRKNTEYKVRLKMTGNKSGLSKLTTNELTKLNDLFDLEVHGGYLSQTNALSWMQTHGPLSVLPEFNEVSFAMFMNRYCEIAWMAHRLLPPMQLPKALLDESWKEKWLILDESFECIAVSLTKQAGKNIGEAIVEFLKAKFPFDQNSFFSL